MLNPPRSVAVHADLSDDLLKYISDVVSVSNFDSCLKDYTEHSHECNGVHWPLILPAEIVLAGRVLVKYIEQQRRTSLTYNLQRIWVSAQIFIFRFPFLYSKDLT